MSKKEESFIFPFKKISQPKKTIGIASLEHHSGCTCISLAFSNYLCNKLRKSTAYIELNTSGQIHMLSKSGKKEPFTQTGFHIFPQTTISALPEILRMNYDYFIFDYGVLNPNIAQEFSRCDYQYLIGDLSNWKKTITLEKSEQYINKKIIKPEYVTFLGNPLIKESHCCRFLSSFYQVYSVPYIKNPFRITSEDFIFYESIFKRKI